MPERGDGTVGIFQQSSISAPPAAAFSSESLSLKSPVPPAIVALPRRTAEEETETSGATTSSSTTTSTNTCEESKRKRKKARFADEVANDDGDNNNNNEEDVGKVHKQLRKFVRLHEFSSLESPHPYGVLPEGNRLLLDDTTATSTASSSTSSTSTSLDPLNLLSDEAWYHVFEFCDGTDLSRVVQCCRFFYVAGYEPELWRDLVLRDRDQQQPRKNKTLSRVGTSWRDTYVIHQLEEKKNEIVDNNNADATKKDVFVPHVALSMKGIFSDFLYRLHSCRSFAIPDVWLSGRHNGCGIGEYNVIPSIPVDEMTTERFLNDFERPNRPVVIQEGASRWQACQKWHDAQYCLQHVKEGQTFRATSGVAPLSGQFTLEAYYQYCLSTKHLEEAPLYLFDRTALTPRSELWNDYMLDLKKTCSFWDPKIDYDDETGEDSASEIDDPVGHDLFKLLGEGRRPDHTWLILGPRRSGSVFHIDPNATHAWNAAICGRKRWIFYPPGVTPPGVYPSSDGDQVALPLSVGEWIFQFWEEHVKRMKSAPPNERPLECTALPGDVLFVPHGWWHLVINLDEINIAITHNYVSASNLSSVLKFLSEKRDQVSGCRDRNESVKPEQLYEEFVDKLRSKHPQWLQQALSSDWACRAWTTPSSETKEEDSAQINRKPGCLSNKKQKHIVSGDDHDHHGTVFGSSIMEKAKSGESSNSGFSFSFL